MHLNFFKCVWTNDPVVYEKCEMCRKKVFMCWKKEKGKIQRKPKIETKKTDKQKQKRKKKDGGNRCRTVEHCENEESQKRNTKTERKKTAKSEKGKTKENGANEQTQRQSEPTQRPSEQSTLMGLTILADARGDP